LLQQQKSKLPFYLYAYCLMPNHVHLLIEMRGFSFYSPGNSPVGTGLKECLKE
jgi:REP element-mobilizing transposase RayT